MEFLLWLSRLRTQHCICGDAGMTPGLAYGVKGLALLWLWHRSAAAALIWSLAWNFCMPWVWPLKEEKMYNEKNLNQIVPTYMFNLFNRQYSDFKLCPFLFKYQFQIWFTYLFFSHLFSCAYINPRNKSKLKVTRIKELCI